MRATRRSLLSPSANVWPKGDRLPRPLRWKFFLRNLSLEPEQASFNDSMSLFRAERQAISRPAQLPTMS